MSGSLFFTRQSKSYKDPSQTRRVYALIFDQCINLQELILAFVCTFACMAHLSFSHEATKVKPESPAS